MKLNNHFHRYDSLSELYHPNDEESDFESIEWVRGPGKFIMCVEYAEQAIVAV